MASIPIFRRLPHFPRAATSLALGPLLATSTTGCLSHKLIQAAERFHTVATVRVTELDRAYWHADEQRVVVCAYGRRKGQRASQKAIPMGWELDSRVPQLAGCTRSLGSAVGAMHLAPCGIPNR